jgi:hypothetical protein
LEKVLNAPDIFEYDLKGFFDSISLDYISYNLAKMGVPIQIVRQLYFINTCAVKLPKRLRMNEFEHMMKSLLHKSSPDEVINAPRPISFRYRVRGVPQGCPTSPFLSAVALSKAIMGRNIPCVQYADDGLYYGQLHEWDSSLKAGEGHSFTVPSSKTVVANYNPNSRVHVMTKDEQLYRLQQSWQPYMSKAAWDESVKQILSQPDVEVVIPADDVLPEYRPVVAQPEVRRGG